MQSLKEYHRNERIKIEKYKIKYSKNIKHIIRKIQNKTKKKLEKNEKYLLKKIFCHP